MASFESVSEPAKRAVQKVKEAERIAKAAPAPQPDLLAALAEAQNELERLSSALQKLHDSYDRVLAQRSEYWNRLMTAQGEIEKVRMEKARLHEKLNHVVNQRNQMLSLAIAIIGGAVAYVLAPSIFRLIKAFIGK